MKVKLTDRKLVSQYGAIISVLCGILSVVLIFVDVTEHETFCLLAYVMMLAIIYFILFRKANRLETARIKVDRVSLEIKYGDLFKEEGLKVIGFNEYFDTIVDEKIISSKTLNGMFLQRQEISCEEINGIVLNDAGLQQNRLDVNENRPYGNRQKFKLGSTIKYKDYLIVAFSKFNERNDAYLTIEDYFGCMVTFWNEANHAYGGKNIAMPLMGAGITRKVNGNKLSPQDILELMIMSLKYSNAVFAFGTKVTIVLPERLKKEINLFDIKDVVYD